MHNQNGNTIYDATNNLLSESIGNLKECYGKNEYEKSALECLIVTIAECIRNIFIKDDRYKYEWRILFNHLKLENIEYVRYREYENKKVYMFSVDFTFSFTEFKKSKEVIERFVHVESERVELELKNDYLYISIYNELDIDYVYNPDIHKFEGFELILGYNFKGEPIFYDFSKASNMHLGLFAATRYGKSNLLNIIICQFAQMSRRKVELVFIDPKQVDMIMYKDLKNTVSYTTDDSYDGEANEILEDNIKEMNKRYRIFQSEGVRNIENYKKKGNIMPFRFIIIDEIGTFAEDKKFMRNLTQIFNKGIGCGIVCIVANQVLNSEVLPKSVINNMSLIGGKTKDKYKSNSIMEGSELHLIKNVGEFKLYNSYYHGELIKTLLIEDDVVDEIIKENIKKPLKNGHSLKAQSK